MLKVRTYPVSVKAIIWRGSAVLFLKNLRGEWELPGGRPEAGETEIAALAREIEEECKLQLTKAEFYRRELYEVIKGRWVEISAYRCECINDQRLILSDEHSNAGWLVMTGERPHDLPEFYWSLCRRSNLLQGTIDF
ncbi:NUDIX domain-containing protein [Caballeronia sp. LZ001]|uniref:NUDIX domain-containing protein n=1 Tax=Caballeronia sp. LZ001 TaxID=3038553 RepID=UPI0028641393|nr:NUDIX domain-containing protein [Caballeronia sp. LZ001]MDR5800624.1 NUDIX domain-containing protein [Caballeronia sp. LZ001]